MTQWSLPHFHSPRGMFHFSHTGWSPGLAVRSRNKHVVIFCVRECVSECACPWGTYMYFVCVGGGSEGSVHAVRRECSMMVG